MATNLLPIQPHSILRASASATASNHPKSGNTSDSTTKNWWTPLFGWSSEPDYINNSDKLRTTISSTTNNNNNGSTDFTMRSNRPLASESMEQRSVRSPVSSVRVKFTDEKAKKLRMLTSETESFHDAMYHSAIASRYASDFSDRTSGLKL